jgi:hypothetical protein
VNEHCHTVGRGSLKASQYFYSELLMHITVKQIAATVHELLQSVEKIDSNHAFQIPKYASWQLCLKFSEQ